MVFTQTRQLVLSNLNFLFFVFCTFVSDMISQTILGETVCVLFTILDFLSWLSFVVFICCYLCGLV